MGKANIVSEPQLFLRKMEILNTARPTCRIGCLEARIKIQASHYLGQAMQMKVALKRAEHWE